MSERSASLDDLDLYVASLTDEEREGVAAASAALDVARLLYRARIFRDLTQTAAAEATGFRQQAISRMEGGETNVTIRTLERYIRQLGFALELLLRDRDSDYVIDRVALNPGRSRHADRDLPTQAVLTDVGLDVAASLSSNSRTWYAVEPAPELADLGAAPSNAAPLRARGRELVAA